MSTNPGDQTVTELTTTTTADAADLLHIIDVSESVHRKNKKILAPDLVGSAITAEHIATALVTTPTALNVYPASTLEDGVPVTPSDFTQEYDYIERVGGAINTDSTTAFETAASIGRQDIRFRQAGRTDTLNDYSEFYILRDAFVAGHSVIGPANFTSDGTQVESILRLGRDPDNANGTGWRARKVYVITF